MCIKTIHIDRNMKVNTKPELLFDESTTNLVSISGGKDSLAMWLLAKEMGVPNLVCAFADTGHEHDITYDYMDYLEKTVGPVKRVKADFTDRINKKRDYVINKWPDKLMKVTPGRWKQLDKNAEEPDWQPEDETMFRDDIVELGFKWLPARPAMTKEECEFVIDRATKALIPTGNPFLDLCVWKGRFPSTRARFCSFELKHEPIRKQIVEPLMLESDDVVSWQGVRAQESHARKDLAEWVEDADDTSGLHVYRPIHKWTHDDVFAIAKRHGIDPNPLYQMGCSRVGCMPCIHVNKSELREIFQRFPEVIERIRNWEQAVAAASKRGNSAFFCSSTDPMNTEHDNMKVSIDSHGIDSIHDWAMTSRGGRQFDMLAGLNDMKACSSVYAGVCE